jgi:methionyl aminopeptidase
MIYYKKEEEIEIIHQGGIILNKILDQVIQDVRPGASTLKLEEKALSLIEAAGGRPSFKDYEMGGGLKFPTALCVSINDEVVHGSAFPERILNSGDIVDLDIGMEWPIQSREESLENKKPFNKHSKFGGFYTDHCRTVPVGKISSKARKLIQISEEALYIGIDKAVKGNTLNDIGEAIENYIKKHGFSSVRDLVGHGIGYFAHESPNIFNYKIGKNSIENMTLRPGMVIAIEPMINEGGFDVVMDKNGYTVKTADGSLSSHFEHTVAILENGNKILTQSKYE